MLKRYVITKGARTSANGRVATASSAISVNGALVAVEGDYVDCPACGTTGIIKCIGPRLPERWNGKDVALDDDLCVCGCIRPPRMVASQNIKYQTVDPASTGWVSSSNRAPGRHGQAYDQRFVLRDSLTGVPLARQPYRIRLAEKVVEGVTDEDGYTHLIPTGMASERIEFEILGVVAND